MPFPPQILRAKKSKIQKKLNVRKGILLLRGGTHHNWDLLKMREVAKP
jgi:hypothetical protein